MRRIFPFLIVAGALWFYFAQHPLAWQQLKAKAQAFEAPALARAENYAASKAQAKAAALATGEVQTALAHVGPSKPLGARTKTSGCRYSGHGKYPDYACSPGAVDPRVSQATIAKTICVSGYSSSVRDVPSSEKRAVYAEYGISHHSRGQYEVDHIVSLELGGSNDIANLFPEPASPKPGFHQKDVEENALHQAVCDGKLTLKQAQWLVAHQWLSLYLAAHP